MSRNYNLGSRNMKCAARFGLRALRKRKGVSFRTEESVALRFELFVDFLLAETDVRRMEHIRAAHVVSYGQRIAGEVRARDKSAAYGQNLVSAINTVMTMATKGRWISVSPTKDCGIPERRRIRVEVPSGLNPDDVKRAADTLRHQNERMACILDLARALGLRLKEACLANASAMLRQARKTGSIRIARGTKGGQARQVQISSERQWQALERAATAQGKHNCLVPNHLTFAQFLHGAIKASRPQLKALGIQKISDLRAAFACELYEALQGHAPPVVTGRKPVADDTLARKEVTEILGHHRIDIVGAYVGGR